ncbi:MAG: hypothetical protein E7I45_00220 [Eikenella corrodens]|uniref:hypothetical protein n=1 Tax=Eikenella corrodens TaxID=539 RepID=UPI00290CAF51|nr:hypothetical protein [Eikenella corrodens]MDU4299396.1 hypothetical protein [Eikenella corrodens]
MTTDKQPRFTAETDSYDGRKKLVLHLPPGSPQLDDFWCSDEHDFELPDACIEIDMEKLHQALAVVRAHPWLFEHVAIGIAVYSDGYEGKLRQSRLEITSYGQNGCLIFYVRFVNDWTGTDYTFDASAYWPVEDGRDLYQYLKERLGLQPENRPQSGQ